MRGRSGWALWAAPLVLVGAGEARAFQIADPIHHNCHEQLASAALAEVGYLPWAPPAAALADQDRRFLDDADARFTYDRNMHMAALITGIRYPDLEGNGDFHFNELAPVHNAVDGQGNHCLRALTDEGAVGDQNALVACRAFITDQFHLAVAAADDQGRPDPSKLEKVKVHAPFDGKLDYPLSTFYFHAGVGMHALQDSFAHTFRDPTWHQVQSFYQWSGQVRGTLVELRDGHGHEKNMDDCTTGRPSIVPQFNAARQASADYLNVLSGPVTGDAREKLFTQFLDRWLTLQPGCNLNNRYCDNEVYLELKRKWSIDYPTDEGSGGCESAAGSSLLALLGLGLMLARRRSLGVAALVLGVSLLPALARAEDVAENNDPEGIRYLAHVSASFDNPAFSYGGGVLWQFHAFEVGAEAEHNPWVALDRPKLTLGALNVYARAGWRHQLSRDFSYRAGLNLGFTTLLTETVDTAPGSTGPLVGLEPLSVIYHPAGHLAYELSAFTLMVPEVQLRGWPYGYPQYRINFTMRFH
jgi:hypothetical protein